MKDKMSKTKLAALFCIGLLLLGFGIGQFYTRQAYQMQLEAYYQRAFRELAFHLNGIEIEVAKADAASSIDQKAESWANILRLVYAAQANLGQLPVSGLTLSRIENLLAQVQNETVIFARNAIRGQSGTSEVLAGNVYEQIQYLNGEIQQELAAKESEMNWMSWKQYFQTSITRSSNIEPGRRHPLMKSLMMIEDGMERFPDSDFPGELDRLEGPLLTGSKITKEDALSVARDFLGDFGDNRLLSVINESKGQIETFTVQANPTIDGHPIVIEVSQKQGLVLWMTNPRIVTQAHLTSEESLAYAQQFLAERSYSAVEAVTYQRQQNRIIIGFAPLEEGILIYPQLLKVQVAMDTGEILGFQGLAFYSFMRERDRVVELTPEEAQAKITATGEIVGSRLAVIMNPSFAEVLVYEFRINRGADQFLVYINAKNGFEEKVSRVEPGAITTW